MAVPGRKKASKTTSRKKRMEDLRPEEKPQEFFNRELQWLEFNSRVLHEALDPRTPLLERVRFMGIFTSNLDEFFMKRLGGLRRQVELGSQRVVGGYDAVQQLAAVRAKVNELQKKQAKYFQEKLGADLAASGIHLLPWSKLNPSDKAFANSYFKSNVFPVLTPLAVDPGIPFPFISNLSTSLGVTLKHPERDEKLFARIKVPKIFPQWIQIRNEGTGFRFINLTDIIHNNLKDLFPDMEIIDMMPFRITRNADIELDEEGAEDLLEMVTEELKQRRFGEVVRFEHGKQMDPWMLKFLMDELELTENEVFEHSGPMDYTELKPIADLNLPQLKYEPWTPMIPPELADESVSIFDVIRKQDVLVHHPYESFGASVEKFIKQAVDDPKVLAIKMTLYRTGDDSPFIPLLIRAAELGKQVVVLIELKARFDEERNIHWAHQLENAGVHVVYGVLGFKTHAKTALIVRNENETLRCFVHLGTGNYHKDTAKLYTDFGYFTSKPEFTEDVVELFHFLTGRSLKRSYKKLLVAPINMKDRILAMIAREMENAKAGKGGRIIAKCNSLEDASLGRALYEASQAGVKIDLIIRGFCCLRPGVKGMSENIRVTSVIGRFLEHSRVFYFGNGKSDPLEGDFFISSADWMYRNLLGRIETVAPIEESSHRSRIWEVLQVMLSDRRSAWTLNVDGTYTQLVSKNADELGTHMQLMALAKKRNSIWGGS